MSRMARAVQIGIPHRITHRGGHIFFGEEDRRVCLRDLAGTSFKEGLVN